MNKDNSIMAIKEAISGESFSGQKDVYVSVNGNNYIYENVYVRIDYHVAYMQMEVHILWEEDDSQPNYKEIGLFGSYNTNYQEFEFSNNRLQWQDNNCKIMITF